VRHGIILYMVVSQEPKGEEKRKKDWKRDAEQFARNHKGEKSI